MGPVKAMSGSSSARASFGATAEHDSSSNSARPVLPPEIEEYFLPVRGTGNEVIYRPALLGTARVHFVSTRQDVDRWDEVTMLRIVDNEVPDGLWNDADEWDEDDLPTLENHPEEDGAFQGLPPDLSQKRSYSRWETELKDYLYRNRRLSIWCCKALDATSKPDESESDFRIRLRHAAREERDLQVEKLRGKYASKFQTLTGQIQRAEQKVEREESQKSQKQMSAGISVLTAGALFGRKLTSAANVSRAGTAIRSAGSVAKEKEDIRHAREQLDSLRDRYQDLDAEVESEVLKIQDMFDPDLMELTQDEIKLRKTDVNVQKVVLVWLPHTPGRSGELDRAF